VNDLGRAIFTTYLLPFEVTSALLVIAVVGAVVLARRPGRSMLTDAELPGQPETGPDRGPWEEPQGRYRPGAAEGRDEDADEDADADADPDADADAEPEPEPAGAGEGERS
jgi:hypothetical protein